MGFVLDSILKQDLIGSRDESGTNYETINSDGNSDTAESHRAEDGYILSVTYANGVANSVRFHLQGSLDGVSWAEMPDTEQTITDASGSVTWDVVASSNNFVRIAWDTVSGSLDIYGQYSAKRRH